MNILIKDSEISGEGLFANKNFNKGKIIFEFEGKLVNYQRANINSIQIEINKYLNPFKKNPGHYINHSCKPNSAIKGLTRFIAIKDIKKGEEITVDYSLTVDDKHFRMKCNCKAKNCREIITGYSLLPEKIKKKYKTYTPAFVKQK